MDENFETMNVMFSSDDNYAQHMGVAIYSLLEHNKDFPHIRIFLIENGIASANREKLEQIVYGFKNTSLHWVSFAEWKNQLKLDLAWPISLSAYARLFVASMVPEDISRILYLDCDMIICDSLQELWNTDLREKTLGAVQDFINDQTKASVGVLPQGKYFNAGMLLIDLEQWRKQGVEQACLKFIAEHGGNVTHHDQGVLNGVLKNDCAILPIRYNLMTIHYIFDRRRLNKYFQDHAAFYTTEEIAEAKNKPAILHFTPSFTSRPWVRTCRHPLKKLYWDTAEKTPWAGARPIKDTSKWYVRLIDWRYRNLPY